MQLQALVLESIWLTPGPNRDGGGSSGMESGVGGVGDGGGITLRWKWTHLAANDEISLSFLSTGCDFKHRFGRSCGEPFGACKLKYALPPGGTGSADPVTG